LRQVKAFDFRNALVAGVSLPASRALRSLQTSPPAGSAQITWTTPFAWRSSTTTRCRRCAQPSSKAGRGNHREFAQIRRWARCSIPAHLPAQQTRCGLSRSIRAVRCRHRLSLRTRQETPASPASGEGPDRRRRSLVTDNERQLIFNVGQQFVMYSWQSPCLNLRSRPGQLSENVDISKERFRVGDMSEAIS